MGIEGIIFMAAVIIIWLVAKALFKLAVITFNTALQILMILVVLRIAFAILPQEILQQIREMPQLLRNLFSFYP